ncbi:MAG TPA: PQQ-binding-like beta-propeller repeat protein [Candidatus Limnocylindria bacterium]|nr:PQQ-binding-like beta-propeller repeat protein [Candidatus Limnocylindria bacterium]
MRWFPPLLLALVALGVPRAYGDCTSGTCVPGGGPTANDCTAEFLGAGLLLNYPPYVPADPQPKTELRCYEGDAGCDADGRIDGVCTFNMNVCLAASDPALPDCTVTTVDKVSVKAKGAKAQALADAVRALASPPACTTGQTLAVALKGNKKEARATVKVTAAGSAGRDKDVLKLRCIRRDWPSHGFSHANHRSTPYERKIGPDNVAKLKLEWTFRVDEQTPDWILNGVTATPTMGHGLLFVPAWNNTLYALSPKNGTIKWSYAAPGGIGIHSSAAVTADGRVIIADGLTVVHCLDARSGSLLWKTDLNETIGDHVWSSPQVANNRVFIGISGFTDTDVGRAPGRLAVLDLDTGAVLWQRRMVPAKVCRTDASVTCTTEADCPDAGACVTAYGAGVTATPAIGVGGEDVFVNTVGSYRFPAVGENADAIMRLDAATGEVKWIRQVTPLEQFGFCTADTALECSTDAMCDTAGPCVEKTFYHDFGFLNGPLLVTADDGQGGTRELVVSGSKDGSLHALDAATGEPVWRNEVLPTPVSPAFAGYGLFNGAVGYADGRFYAALFQLIAPGPQPEHLMAFSEVDGATVWTDEIGPSWSHVGLANGVLYAATEAAPEFYAYDAQTGTRLATFTLPEGTTSAGGPIVVDGTLYLPYGVDGNQGGVQAYRLR